MMKYRKRILAMTEVCVGNKCVMVPCAVACETKRLINKFHLVVTDVHIDEPYFIDVFQWQEFYELVLTVKPSMNLRRRRFVNAHERTCMKFAKRYGWDLTIIEE